MMIKHTMMAMLTTIMMMANSIVDGDDDVDDVVYDGIPCYGMTSHDMSLHALPCHGMLCYAMFCHVVPCRVMSCRVVPSVHASVVAPKTRPRIDE